MTNRSNIVSFEEVRRKRRESAETTHVKKKKAQASKSKRSSAGSATVSIAAEKRRSPAKTAVSSKKRKASADVSGSLKTKQVSPARASRAKKSADIPDPRKAAKTRRAKERASRKFDKMYGGAKASGPVEGGPRAAVYQAKMGTKHRQAASALAKGTSTVSSAISGAFGRLGSIQLPSLGKMSKRALHALFAVAAVCFMVVMLYSPAQQYYLQMRERDRVNAEYAAVLERNEALEKSVETLQSDSGIEDKAHSEYGMIKEGEEAGSVAGIDVIGSTDFVANVTPGAVPPEDTWYSGVLDVIFGYHG